MKKYKVIFIMFAAILVCSLSFLSAKSAYQQIKKRIHVNKMANLMDVNSKEAGNVPILECHCVDNSIFGQKDLFVSPGHFDMQMKYLHDRGYTPITFEQMKEASGISKPVIITFDDGYEDNFRDAFQYWRNINSTRQFFHNRFSWTQVFFKNQ